MTGDKSAGKAGNGESIPRGIVDPGRVISYNLSEGERPGGIKVRYKVRIATGRRAKVIDARQADVIREVLEWSRQHRQQDSP